MRGGSSDELVRGALEEEVAFEPRPGWLESSVHLLISMFQAEGQQCCYKELVVEE